MRAELKNFLKTALPTPVYNRLRLMKMRSDRARFEPRVVEHEYAGICLKVSIEDKVGEDWYDRPWPTAGEIAFLKQHSLKSGARIFDIGAHQGLVATLLAKEVGPSGQVVAVEANPANAQIARKNFGLNQVNQAVVKHAAVAEAPGKLVLNEDSNGQIDESGQLGRIEVDAVTVDQLSKEFGKPDLIFLDIEGFETFALKGAVETLKQAPDLFIEVHVGAGLEKFGGSVAQLFELIPAEKYQFYFAEDKEPVRFEAQPLEFFRDPQNPKMKIRFFLAAIRKR